MNVTDELLKSIEIMIDHALKRKKTTEVYIGNISSVSSDGYVVVKYNGKDIKIKPTDPMLYKKNDIVKICIPCGNRRYAFIVDEPLTAKFTKYDNSKSGLQAKNINDAIDELYRTMNEVKTTSVSVSEDMVADE